MVMAGRFGGAARGLGRLQAASRELALTKFESFATTAEFLLLEEKELASLLANDTGA